MGIEGIHVFVSGGEDGALDKVGVLPVGNVIERAINMVNEAARVAVQLVGTEHKRRNDDVFWRRRRRRRRWRRVRYVERRRRRGRPSLTDSKEEIREPFQFMVGCSSKACGLDAHVLQQLKDADISPEVAGAKGSTHSSGLVLVLDDWEDLAVVSRANDDLAAERDAFKGRVDVGH
jgi:hypothetical protein